MNKYSTILVIIEKVVITSLLLLFMQSESFDMSIRSVNIRNNFKRSFTQLMSTNTAASVAKSHNYDGNIGEPTIRTPSIPIVANLYVDKTLLDSLQMRNNLRKAKLLISTKQQNTTIETLKSMIETKFKPLRNYPYRINYKYTCDIDTVVRPILTAENIGSILTHAQETSKSLQLYISGEPGVLQPTPIGGLVQLPADPNETDSFTMVSFFSFHPIEDPQYAMKELYRIWKPIKALGRIYVAKEGINAQMAIPTNLFDYFQTITKQLPYFTKSRFNTDPAVTREEYLQTQPFRALHIRIRPQIVADGLNEVLDWEHAGTELTPTQWHEALVKGASSSGCCSSDTSSSSTVKVTETKNANGEPITLLDCRNTYETDVGLFEGAKPLNTTTFRDSWVALDEALQGISKEKPIYTYCTGGIRCVKINAYLEQKLGFANTYRLQGGIIAYRRELAKEQHNKATTTLLHQSTLEDASDSEASVSSSSSSPVDLKFKGVNYVFDERIVERISDDILTKCETCGQPNDSFINCKNYACNVRFIQCNNCRGSHDGCCSTACKNEHFEDMKRRNGRTGGKASSKPSSSSPLKNRNMMTASMRQQAITKPPSSATVSTEEAATTASTGSVRPAVSTNTIAIQTDFQVDYPTLKSHAQYLDDTTNALAAYSEAHSEDEPALLQTLRQDTMTTFTNPASQRMLSDRSQGSLLSFLASMKGSKAEILELGTFTGYSALSLAMNFEDFTQKGSAMLNNQRRIRTCEIDSQAADIAQRYFNQSSMKDQIELHRMSAQDMLSQCREKGWKFDIVFIDADKKSYLSYLQSLLGQQPDGSDSLLHKDALIIADNTLWKGLVLHETEEWKDYSPDAKHFGMNVNRLYKVAEAMHQFNTYVATHPSLRSLLLPIRDGFTVIQYHPPIATAEN